MCFTIDGSKDNYFQKVVKQIYIYKAVVRSLVKKPMTDYYKEKLILFKTMLAFRCTYSTYNGN